MKAFMVICKINTNFNIAENNVQWDSIKNNSMGDCF